jgi:hypothetical protein
MIQIFCYWFAIGVLLVHYRFIRDVTHAPAGPFGILLVVIFGFVKRLDRHNLRYNRLAERFLDFIANLFGSSFLLIGIIKNYAAITVSNIGPLAVKLRGVMQAEKVTYEHFVTEVLWVKSYQNRFGVAGGVCANFFVGGVLGVAAAVTDGRLQHARHLVKVKLHAPKATGTKDGLLLVGWLLGWLIIVHYMYSPLLFIGLFIDIVVSIYFNG